MSRSLYRIAFDFLLVVICLIVVASCLSFDIYDSPSKYAAPHNSPASNWCGSIGAFVAYHCLYYFGPGVYVLALCLIGYAVIQFFEVEYNQLILRVLGLFILTTAVSVLAYLLIPAGGNDFPMGNGGILGIAVGSFMMGSLAGVGTYIIVLSSVFVGAFLISDTLVLMLMNWSWAGICHAFGFANKAVSKAAQHSEQLKDIWVKLNEKQREAKAGKSAKSVKAAKSQALKVKTLRPSIAIPPKGSGKNDVLIEDALDQDQQEQPAPKIKKRKKSKTRRFKVNDSLVPVENAEDVSTAAAESNAYVMNQYENYEYPPLELLEEPEEDFGNELEQMVKEKAYKLEAALREFGVQANVVNAEPGPAITMYELELGSGIKVSQITNLSNDMCRALGAQSVRVVAPLPGRHTIGIEVPNSKREIVRLKDLIEKANKKYKKQQIPLFLGKDSAGDVLFSDLAAMPHMLIAGTTGSGKSVCINSIITSILMLRRPDEVKLILVDPKMVEMTSYENVPHLMCPIVTDTRKAEQILEWATTKMDERYALLNEAKVRNIADFNKLGSEEIIRRFDPATPEEEAKLPKKLPYIVIIVDELADLMMTSGKEIEGYIVRLAQKSRAIGIHIVLATQRPQATVVTGLIKSNMPARISFRVAGRMDSRIILDQNGGETLLGQGDMLFLKPGTSDLVRSQGAFLEDSEVHAVVDHLKTVAKPQYHPELMQLNTVNVTEMKKDEMFDDAVRIVLETKRGSVSLLQRKLSIGYARASRIIELMGASGILGEYKGAQAREVLLTLDEWDAMQKNMRADATAGFSDMQEDEQDEVEETPVAPEPAEEEYEEAEEEGDEEFEYVDQEDEEFEYEEGQQEPSDDDDDEYDVHYEYVDEDED